MALRKNSRKLFDMGRCQNLPEELPTVEQLKGNTKLLASLVGVIGALDVVEEFSGLTDIFNDGFKILIDLRNKRLERDYYDGGLEIHDLSRKYGICTVRVKQILGQIHKESKILC